ncbi:sensor histidine kinase [Oryzifoliimicrobium ureilyticus]|uniref:sensor histidine kinase n=1 Tax=Oryzifoliimicrobium ureilyticus TaxID=3113724 RepID=UPI00307658CF
MQQAEKPSTPLASLTRAIADIARARTACDVVGKIRSTARSLIGCEGITVVLRDGDFCNYVEEDAIKPLWKGRRFPMASCVSGWAMLNQQTVIIPDISQDERVPYEFYRDTFVQAMAMAPIRTENPLGAIGAYWSQKFVPSEWEIEVLEALAEAASVALENAEVIASLSSALVKAERQNADLYPEEVAADIACVDGIEAVATILNVVLQMTGMGFAAVARVTEKRWIACKVLDHVSFGLKPGDELPLESTLCSQVRAFGQAVAFDDAHTDPVYCNHHTPRIYGLRSYIAVPIFLANGEIFGTLCAIDANPAQVNNPQVLATFNLFAELIGQHLDASPRLVATQTLLADARELGELREYFIAVLGHDLRNPLAALDAGLKRIMREGWVEERSPQILALMGASLTRMSGLVNNIMDLARTRFGDGIGLDIQSADLRQTLSQIVDELHAANPKANIVMDIDLAQPVAADHQRLAQMLSNLVSNALTHGAKDEPITVRASTSASHLEIAVMNRGEAISPENIKTLFLPFRRGGSKQAGSGLGLGLHIAQQIAQAHRGTIDVTSTMTQTCFAFRMPLAPAMPPEIPAF